MRFGTYCHVTHVPVDSDLLLIVEQIGETPDGKLPADGIAHFRNALANVVAILESEGATQVRMASEPPTQQI